MPQAKLVKMLVPTTTIAIKPDGIAQKNNQRREILWDEESRISTIAGNSSTHNYMYDASGERLFKATGDGQ